MTKKRDDGSRTRQGDKIGAVEGVAQERAKRAGDTHRDAGAVVADAHVDLKRKQENLQHDIEAGLSTLDHDVAALHELARTDGSGDPSGLAAALVQTAAKRAALVRALEASRGVSAASWTQTAASLNEQWQQLRASVPSQRAAKAR